MGCRRTEAKWKGYLYFDSPRLGILTAFDRRQTFAYLGLEDLCFCDDLFDIDENPRRKLVTVKCGLVIMQAKKGQS